MNSARALLKGHVRPGALTILCALFLQTVAGGPAQASCALPPPLRTAIAQSEHVFVGTVTNLENSRRWATVEVEEVWNDEDLPEEVEVRAGPKDPPGPISSASSVDRSFRLGQRYIFLPFERRGSIFIDNACSRTSRFRPSYERFAPESPEPPQETDQPSANEPDLAQEPDDPEERSSPLLFGTIILILLTAGLLLHRHKTQRP